MKKLVKIKKQSRTGPVLEIIIFTLFISVLSFILNILKVSGFKTDPETFQTTLLTINNALSKAGIRHLLNNSLVNFQTLEPLAMVIMSLIAVSILEASGLLKHIFTPIRKIKYRHATFMILLVGIISTIIGDYSYVLLLPIAGIFYKYIGRDSTLGILTMFIAITIGYGTGIMYNHLMYELGDITELSASGIISNYNYELLSNIFFLIVSTVILSIFGTIILEKFAKNYSRNEQTDNLNISKKAGRATLVSFLGMILIVIYSIIPGLPHSGMLLDKAEPTYIGKLFGSSSPLNQGFMFLIIAILMVCGFIYGHVSKNIKNSNDYSAALTKAFEGTGYVFVLLFFISILYLIMDWTNIPTVLATNIVDFLGKSNLSGVVLVIVAFLSIVLISLLIPSSVAKWNIVAPIYVPLLMRANISPSFTQTLFQAADSVGKLFSPIYVYFIIAIGLVYKYDSSSNKSIMKTMKKVMPVTLLLSLIWLVIVIGWYLIGLPIGINSNITL